MPSDFLHDGLKNRTDDLRHAELGVALIVSLIRESVDFGEVEIILIAKELYSLGKFHTGFIIFSIKKLQGFGSLGLIVKNDLDICSAEIVSYLAYPQASEEFREGKYPTF